MIVDQNSCEFRDFREHYLRELEKDLTPEKSHIRLVAMAHALQMTLSLPRHDIPKQFAFDVLMRAVVHGISADPACLSYVCEVARLGINILECSWD